MNAPAMMPAFDLQCRNLQPTHQRRHWNDYFLGVLVYVVAGLHFYYRKRPFAIALRDTLDKELAQLSLHEKDNLLHVIGGVVGVPM